MLQATKWKCKTIFKTNCSENLNKQIFLNLKCNIEHPKIFTAKNATNAWVQNNKTQKNCIKWNNIKSRNMHRKCIL